MTTKREKPVESVCVYCGSSDHVDQVYKDSAHHLGTLLGSKNIRVVYGGGNVGLMGTVANAALDAGGEVYGIIPSHIADKEVAHHELTKLDVVGSMHERKQLMVDNSDAFVILPGGLGTMDEFFEALTWWQLGLHDKQIIIANIAGYWDPLLSLIDHIVEHKFARGVDQTYLSIVDSIEDVMEALKELPPENVNPQSKWI